MHVERELDRSMMARLEGLLSKDRFASEMSAMTRVMIILQDILLNLYYIRKRQ